MSLICVFYATTSITVDKSNIKVFEDDSWCRDYEDTQKTQLLERETGEAVRCRQKKIMTAVLSAHLCHEVVT